MEESSLTTSKNFRKEMKILIDIGHPAHVHLFKHFAWSMLKKGHTLFFTCRDKESEVFLLKRYGFKYKSIGKPFLSTIGKIFGLLKFDLQLFLTSIRFKPDILLSHGSMYAAHAAWLIRKPHISLEDTGNWEQVRLYKPFTPVILTSDLFPHDYGEKQIRFKSHNELAYLHPDYYDVPESTKNDLGFKKGRKHVVMRFVSWNATHDKGQKGLSQNTKRELIELLSEDYDIHISSEGGLPPDLKKYSVKFSPEKVHDALCLADLFVGEGITMAMEAAVLGTPAIYINSLQYAYVKDMEKYGLVFLFKDEVNIIQKVKKIISELDSIESYQKKRNAMLSDKIDLTAFLIWFVENYPESFHIMKGNPSYQDRFKTNFDFENQSS